jgi:hypothetical protein
MRKYVFTALFVLLVAGVQASASVITFTGEDLNAGPGSPDPSSAAAAASFSTAAGALGTDSTITFEGAPLGGFTNLTVAPGVSISGTDFHGNLQTVLNSPSFAPAPALGGFNTTPGGSEYVNVLGGTLTFTFAVPTQFFGAYFDGVQTAFFQDVIQFSDGTSQTVDFPGVGTTNSNGAWDFVGFVDPGASITSITIDAGTASLGADEIGVDDVQYQSGTVVPEPSSVFLSLAGLGLFAIARRRYRLARA